MPNRHLVPQVLAAVACCGVALSFATPAGAQGRPDCSVVLRAIHDATGHQHAKSPDAQKIAKRLGADVSWVERCAQSYGRTLKKHEQPPNDGEADSQFDAKREAEEYEELSREERDTLGDNYFSAIENDDQDRRKLRRNRDADTINEWEPFETHEWGPNTGHEWSPYMHDDDLGDF